jgi:ABC-2 type transport system ATP-binding protein
MSTLTTPVVEAVDCSKWYGQVLGVSSINWTFNGGIVGLLGPNGAGKSSFMKMLVGLAAPSRGTVRVFGQDPFHNPAPRQRIGYAPEHEKTYDELTALELVTFLARLSGVPNAQSDAAAKQALETMGMTEHMGRAVKGFSKGMRQRTKLASALVHQPELLILDEPLTGVDPMARIDIIERVKKIAATGTSVVISSHVLYEIEALTTDIVVVYRGQVLAEGNIYDIRKLIDKHPHRIRIECDRPRAVAAAVANADHITRIAFERDAVVLETKNPDACYQLLGATITNEQLHVHAMTSPDNNLSAVFDYLTGGGAG